MYDKFVALEASLLTTSSHHFNQHTIQSPVLAKGSRDSVIYLLGSLIQAKKGFLIQHYWKILHCITLCMENGQIKNTVLFIKVLGWLILAFHPDLISYYTKHISRRVGKCKWLGCFVNGIDLTGPILHESKEPLVVYLLNLLWRKCWSRVSLKLVSR